MSKHAPPYPNAATDPFNQVPGMNRPPMTAETDLLPLHYDELPEIPEDIVVRMQSYARANVEHATAPLQAEIEALRAEVDALREALEEIRSRSTMNLAMQPDLFALAAKLGYIHQVADAAIDRARTSGADDEA